jgi:hypothetical protein
MISNVLLVLAFPLVIVLPIIRLVRLALVSLLYSPVERAILSSQLYYYKLRVCIILAIAPKVRSIELYFDIYSNTIIISYNYLTRNLYLQIAI